MTNEITHNPIGLIILPLFVDKDTALIPYLPFDIEAEKGSEIQINRPTGMKKRKGFDIFVMI
jgi:hypothetical protein